MRAISITSMERIKLLAKLLLTSKRSSLLIAFILNNLLKLLHTPLQILRISLTALRWLQ